MYALILLIFLAYTLAVFALSSFPILALCCVFNIGLMFFARVRPRPALFYFLRLLPFIVFASAVNFFFDGFRTGLLFFIRLLLVCHITHCFRYVLPSRKLAGGVEFLMTPLRLFKLNPRDTGLMISICLAFIPVLGREMEQLKLGLKAKGLSLGVKNAPYILRPLIAGIFKRTGEITLALKAKAYIEA